MVLAKDRPKTSRRRSEPRRDQKPALGDGAGPTRAESLGRIAARVSGQRDVADLFDDIIDEAFALFGVDRAGLWLYHPASDAPLDLAAQRGLPSEILEVVAKLPPGASTAGMIALRSRKVRVLDPAMRSTTPALREVYRRIGVRSVCFVPVVFGDDVLGLLSLYHREAYPWTPDQRALARAFGDQMASAIGNARLADSRRNLADRLHSIAELGSHLSQLHDREAIAWAIVAEAKRLTDHDTIRVYRVDHGTSMCEPLAFEGTFNGSDAPSRDVLRVPIGQGLTGWVAEHGRPIRSGDAAQDPRGRLVGVAEQTESMLVVPMVSQDVVIGVIVVSALGRDRFDDEDELTLTIFAASAVQALVNAENLQRLQRQQVELEHQIDGQRRLIDVNERLLSTLDPTGVLDLIADSLEAIVPYDSLTVYRVDHATQTRRAVMARDPFADEILADAGPAGSGLTGWAMDHGEPLLSNEAHLDPRAVQVPGTSFEPESMIVVPLFVSGTVIGTLNIGRSGGAEAAFNPNEFELTKLFAGHVSIALQNAETHGEVSIRAEHDALTGLRNHGAFQRELGEALDAGRPFAVLMLDLDAFKAFNDALGHLAGDGLLVEIARAMSGATREGDRLYRYGGDEFAVMLPGANRVVAHEVAERIRLAVRERTDVAVGPDGAQRPLVTVSAGIACYPEDGRTKTELVTVADRALYQVKPMDRRPTDVIRADPYLRALDETALEILDGKDHDDLLDAILSRATALLGTPHAFIDLVEADEATMSLSVAKGLYTDLLGVRFNPGEGLAGEVVRVAGPVVVPDYDEWPGRSPNIPTGVIGSVVAVPLTSAGRVVGVLGLAAGTTARQWVERDLEVLTRFAKLASVGLDNARLTDIARRGALHDPTTGLPNRELMTDRIEHALAGPRGVESESIAVVLINLDRFRLVNESLGHAAGDRLLVGVGQRLAHGLRPGDTVARFGGDEFGIILDPVEGPDEAMRIAGRIESELRAPFPLNGREWFISASLGVALATPGRSTPGELLREAEIAMVRAKADSTQRPFLFEPSMSDQTLERLELEKDLRAALERHELRVHYQPIVRLTDEVIVGFEALVRWQHPTRGLVAPLSFIPLAEDTGLIVPLGRWVLKTACRQAARWHRNQSDPDATPLFVSVNLSASEFLQPDLVEDVAAILAECGLDPGELELEITESVVMDQSEAGIRALRRLRDLGVRLVLDDFGTGYSSLAYLKHLPLDLIKIDRSFVTGIDQPADRSIVQAVIALAHGLGIGVVAEGIETDRQAELTLELGCDLGQGYLFSRPVPAAKTALLLRAAPRTSLPRAV